MKRTFKKVVSFLLCLNMVASMLPTTSYAAVNYEEAEDDYYKVISKDDYELAPGIVESEIVLNNSAGSQRQVAHVVEVDLDNEYTKVMPSYKGMADGLNAQNYGVQVMSEQAKWAEENDYGNVVAAMNLSLSWYNSTYYEEHPELVGEPLGYLVMDGEYYENSQGKTSGAQTCVVINYDEKDGETRPEELPKIQIRSTSEAITGWEEQVIPANFGYLVKDGVNQSSVDNNANNGASRSFVGIKEDGTFVMVMNDGRQSPYSAGFTSYEMGEFMLSLGCVVAINGDGGGSSTFLSQRPGEELTLNCSPSDGTERPTTHGILVISTAPATGEFVRANITTEYDYYTPGSTVTFEALGTDLVGTVAEIPESVEWQIKEEEMGTIEDGVFVSNGNTGTVTAQMVYNGAVVGEASVEIVIPETLAFTQSVMTVPFDKTVTIGLKATINDGLHEVVLNPEDITLTTTNEELGTFDGFQFTSVSEENAPENCTSTLTATLVHDTSLVATATLNLGRGSEVLFDFEEKTDVDAWNVAVVNGYHESGFYCNIESATTEDGEVHDGNGSLRLETNGLAAEDVSAGGYAQVPIYLNDGVVVENAKSIGFWAYIPDEYEHCWIRVLYWYDSDGNGTYDKKNTVTVINQPEVYNTWDESGWKYFSVDVSAYESILIPGVNDSDDVFPASNHTNKGTAKESNDYRFIEFMFPHTGTNDLWKTFGTLNGPYTIYIDNITADYSDAVDDREEPTFDSICLIENDGEIALEKYNTVTTKNNLLNVTAKVSENTNKSNATGLDGSSAKAYVDGVEVNFTYKNGRFAISDLAVADGVHRVKFEICDVAGNKAVVIRLVEVDSGVKASTVQVVPADETLDRLYGGSVYWMNVNATNIETIQEVSTVIDLNSVNHWELAHMELAEGFTAKYVIDGETNTATITITRTGINTQTGEAILASLPIRVIYYDTDIHVNGYTAGTFWNSYNFWPQDVKVDVDMGKITYVDGYDSKVLNVFSNEEFGVDTEMYISSANMDSTFKTERGTAHVHTPEKIEDKEATCTEAGYEGRTYCKVCDSVVEWGSIIAPKGHSFDSDLGDEIIQTCKTCEKSYSKDNYVGWQVIEGKDYYFTDTAEVVDGEYEVDGHTYTFAESMLIDAAWEHDGTGLTAWWAGEPVKGGTDYESKWKTINGNKYYFTDIYAATGLVQVKISTDLGYKYHIFDENGVWLENYTGLYDGTYDGKQGTYYVENGICVYKGLVMVDGYYYYINSTFKAVKSQSYYVSRTNDLLPAGEYTFDEEGKMINPPSSDESETKNGIYEEDGKLYYYEDNEKVAKGLVYDEETGNYYYFGIKYYAIGEGQYWFNEVKLNGLTGPNGETLEPGYYTVNADCTVYFEEPKNGIYEEDGKLYYYEDNEKIAKGLVYDEETGNYYYFGIKYYAIGEGQYWFNEVKLNGLTGPNGETLEPGYYTVNADCTVYFEEPKNGIYEEDGKLYYYEDDEKVAKGLVYDEETGNYYYFGIKYYAIGEGQYWFNEVKLNGLTGPNGETLEPGYYTVNADCTVYFEEPKNGIYEEDGKLYYYEDNEKIAKGLVYDEETGNYYYFGIKYYAIGEGQYWFNEVKLNGLTGPNGETLEPGYYTVNADCTVYFEEPKNGIYEEDGKLYYYEDNEKVAKGLVYDEETGNYYCFGIKYYAIGEGQYWFNEAKLNGLTGPNGETLKPGYYTVNADCTVIIE